MFCATTAHAPAPAPAGKLGHVSLRDRSEGAAELLASMNLDGHAELVDRTTRLLRELPRRNPRARKRSCWPMP